MQFKGFCLETREAKFEADVIKHSSDSRTERQKEHLCGICKPQRDTKRYKLFSFLAEKYHCLVVA